MIAIRGLKMPVDCSVCFGRAAIWCRFDKSDRIVVPALPEELLEGRPEWCPLVDVPNINVGNCSEIPNSSDCVSRRAAVEAIANQSRFSLEEIINICDKSVQDENGWFGGLKEAILAVLELPSAQPEFAKDTNVTTNDLIDRQAAIDALIHKWDGMVTSVFDVLKELPSSQPEIILCKDCIHRWHSGGRSVAGKWIRIYRCKRHGIEINLNDFCSYAERKIDEETDI